MRMLIEQQFRQLVEAQLEEKGWTRSELARQMGASPQMVTDYLNGRSKPGPDVIERFLAAFGLEPELKTRKADPAAPPVVTPPRPRRQIA